MANNIRKRREALGMEQSDLAALLPKQYDVPMISKIERDMVMPCPTDFILFANALFCSVCDLSREWALFSLRNTNCTTAHFDKEFDITPYYGLTQHERILKYLDEHPEGLSRDEALVFLGIGQAQTRIFELKRLGYNIVSVWQRNQTNRFGERCDFVRYVLAKEEQDVG